MKTKLLSIIVLSLFLISAIGTTNVSISAIKSETGFTSNNLGTLCTDGNINSWSRARPGYLTTRGDTVFLQAPRGSGFTDPRGSYYGQTDEGYNIGDWREYDHSAIAPKINTISGNDTIEWDSQSGGLSKTATVNFNPADVNWIDSDTTHRTENVIDSEWFLLFFDSDTVDTYDFNNYTSGNISFSADYTTPSAGNTDTYTVKLGFATIKTNVADYYLGSWDGATGERTLTIITKAAPAISWDETGYTGSALTTRTYSPNPMTHNRSSIDITLACTAAEEIVDVIVKNDNGDVTIGSSLGQSITNGGTNFTINVSPNFLDGESYTIYIEDFP